MLQTLVFPTWIVHCSTEDKYF